MVNNACRRAKRALSELCGDEGGNTIWLEFVVSQGRRTEPEDFIELEQLVESVILEEIVGGARSPRAEEGDIFSISGEDRPPEPDEHMFTGGGDNRIHTFIKFENDTLQVGQLQGVNNTLRTRFNESDASIGRGVDSVNIVDEKVIAEAAPERVGPPKEDVEFV